MSSKICISGANGYFNIKVIIYLSLIPIYIFIYQYNNNTILGYYILTFNNLSKVKTVLK